MEILETLYLNNPLSLIDLLLVFLITSIAVPIIYIKTSRKIKLVLILYILSLPCWVKNNYKLL